MAAINMYTLVAPTASNTDATSYLTSSVTPTNGRIAFIISCARRDAGEPTQPTCTGNGQTWVVQGTPAYTAPIKLTIFRAIVASASAGQATIDFAGQTQLAHAYCYIEFDKVNTTTPVVQTKSGVTVGGTGLTVTFDNAFGSVWNGVLIAYANDLTSGTPSVETGYSYTSLAVGTASDGIRLLVGWRSSNDSASVFTSGSANLVGEALELAQDGSDIGSGGGRLVGGSLAG